MDSNKQKNGWGGRREGSGRKAPEIPKKAMSLKLDGDLYDILVKHKLNKNGFINDAVRNSLKNIGLLK